MRFNIIIPDDTPQGRLAARILSQKGRKKGAFIADCICRCENNRERGKSSLRQLLQLYPGELAYLLKELSEGLFLPENGQVLATECEHSVSEAKAECVSADEPRDCSADAPRRPDETIAESTTGETGELSESEIADMALDALEAFFGM